jgi:hypothetical protein
MGNYACILVSNFSESGVWWAHHRIGDAENETHNFADLILLCPGSVVLAQKFDVKIVDRKENETDYSYPVQTPFSGHNGALGNDERAFVVIYPASAQSRTMGPSRRWGTQTCGYSDLGHPSVSLFCLSLGVVGRPGSGT